MKNGNGRWARWSIGSVITIIVGWLTIVTFSAGSHATHDEVSASEKRVTHRLERIEDKVDRLLER